jgi:hypothetical protein
MRSYDFAQGGHHRIGGGIGTLYFCINLPYI